MALQFDNDGFLIGEKKFKELNGNVAQIDNTTKEILAVLSQSYQQDDENGRIRQAQFRQLIEQKKRQNHLIKETINTMDSDRKTFAKIINKQNHQQPNPHHDEPVSRHRINTKNQHNKTIVSKKRESRPIKLADEQKNHQENIAIKKRQATAVQTTPANQTQVVGRDSQGRFVSHHQSAQSQLMQSLGKMSEAVWQYVQSDASQISPEIDALVEIRDVIAPAGRGLQAMGRGAVWLYRRKRKQDELLAPEQDKQNKQVNASNKEKRRLLRLILRGIGDKSWLSSLLPLMAGLAKALGDGSPDIDIDGKGGGGGFFGTGSKKNTKKPPKKPKRPTQRPRHRLPESRKTPNGKKPPKKPKTIWDKIKDKAKNWRNKGQKGLGKVGAGLKRVPIIGTAATLAMGALALSDYKEMTTQERGATIGGLTGSIGGGWAGATAGAVAGAAIGSAVPILGTAAGGLIGGLIGGFGGSWFGGDIGSQIGEKLAPHGAKMVDGLSGWWGGVSNNITAAMTTAGSATYSALTTGYDYTKNLASNAWSMTRLATMTAKEYTLLSLERMKNVVVAGLTGYGGIIGAAVQGVGKIYEIAKNFVVENSSSFIDWIKEKGGGIWDSIKEGAGNLADTVSNAFGGNSNITISNGKVQVGNWKRDLKANKFDELLPMLDEKAKKSGLKTSLVLAMANIESHFDPNARNGDYLGLFQMGASHMKAGENRLNASDNTDAAIRFIKQNKATFHRVMGNDAEFTAGIAYLMHQQGPGAVQYLKNPNMNVVDAAMLNREWRRKGRAATIDMIKKNGGNPNMTAKEYYSMWVDRANALQAAYEGNTTTNTTASKPNSTTNKPNPTSTKTINNSTFLPIGDSIAVGILGKEQANQAVIGKDTKQVKEYIKHQINAGAVKNKDVVLSTGASNEAASVNYKNIEEQIDLLVKAGAKNITMMSVADNWSKQKKAQTYKGKRYKSINEVLEVIAQEKGVRFAKWSTNGKNGYHADKATYEKAIKDANLGRNLGTPTSGIPMPRPTSTPPNGNKNINNNQSILQPPAFNQKPTNGNGVLGTNLRLTTNNISINEPSQTIVASTTMQQSWQANSSNVIEKAFTGDVGQNISDESLARFITGNYSA